MNQHIFQKAQHDEKIQVNQLNPTIGNYIYRFLGISLMQFKKTSPKMTEDAASFCD